MKDDEDIKRERRALATRAKMLAHRFRRSTAPVKITLFRAFCTTFYTCALWTSYTQRSLSDLRIQYNNAFRALLRLPRWCSASGMFADARVDGFQAIMRARCAAALRRLRGSRNSLLAIIADRLDSQLLVHWTRVHSVVATYTQLA
ncbi:uncharacterized protein LOC133529284 [Cydia pomonella]|uniref:uncharacterized protein LOC133529284 n=1 Tax=Cydia pomonella TaxID=82600 RepID=UPI002ADE2811|nr:uncharacterized protein LOC133529284 [Cydia pomonella]